LSPSFEVFKVGFYLQPSCSYDHIPFLMPTVTYMYMTYMYMGDNRKWISFHQTRFHRCS